MLGTISGITSKNSNRGDPKSRGMLYAYVDKMRIDFCRRQMAGGPGCMDVKSYAVPINRSAHNRLSKRRQIRTLRRLEREPLYVSGSAILSPIHSVVRTILAAPGKLLKHFLKMAPTGA